MTLNQLSTLNLLRRVHNGFKWHRSTHSSHRPSPLIYPKSHPSLLPLVLSCSNLYISRGPQWSTPKIHHVFSREMNGDLTQKERVTAFYLDQQIPNARPLGLLRTEVVKALLGDHQRESGKTPWQISRFRGVAVSVSFAPWINEGGRVSREALMSRLVQEWRNDGTFVDILRGWSDEQYPIYHPHSMAGTDDPIAFSIERAALPLFGFPNFGCLMIGYFHSPSDGEIRFWIPRRSRTKRTWPGRLDVTVGGGIDSTSSPLSTIIRECAEEASLPPSVVEANIKATGVLPFPNRSSAGWILPGLYYLYDLYLPPDVHPRINEADGEVERFEVMDSLTLFSALLQGEFKPSSALAIVDFLIRHGYITEDNEPRYTELCLRLRPSLRLTIPWR